MARGLLSDPPVLRRMARGVILGFADLARSLRPWLEALLFGEDAVCPACRAPFRPVGFQVLCLRCYDDFGFLSHWRPLPLNPRLVTSAAALGDHRGALREAVHRLKFRADRRLGLALGYVMGSLALAHPGVRRVFGVVPVPLHEERERQRGFNQAEVLAQGVAAVLGKEVLGHWLHRRRPTSQQAALSERERRSNVEGAFVVPAGGPVRGRSLLLVDDVITTGATVEAAALALREAGAADVYALSLTAAPPPSGNS